MTSQAVHQDNAAYYKNECMITFTSVATKDGYQQGLPIGSLKATCAQSHVGIFPEKATPDEIAKSRPRKG